MASGGITSREGGVLQPFFGGRKGRKTLDNIYKGPPQEETLTSLLVVLEEVDTFLVYRREGHAIAVGRLQDLLKSKAGEKLIVRQELKLSLKFRFEVSQVSLLTNHDLDGTNPSTFNCALWGIRGVAALKISRRPNEDEFHISEEKVIAEDLYRKHPSFSIFQCRWSPHANLKLLAVLNSDSYFRVYNAESGETLECFNLGSPKSLPLATTFSPEIDPETPVDFDFGPYVASSQSCLLAVLKPTGHIFCASMGVVGPTGKLRCWINHYQKMKFHDDAGFLEEEDYSSILCSNEFPIVFTCSQQDGRVSHVLMFPSTDLKDPHMEVCLLHFAYRLYVKERLKFPSVGAGQLPTIRLKQDTQNNYRYMCLHGSGAHIVSMKFPAQLLEMLNSDTETPINDFKPSVFKDLLVWNFGRAAEGKNRVLGVWFCKDKPETLICILHDFRAVLFSLPHPNDILELDVKKDLNSFGEFNPKDRLFLETVKAILRQSSEQPFYCSDQKDGSRESIEVLRNDLKGKCDQLAALEKVTEYFVSYPRSVRVETKKVKAKIQKLLDTRADLKDWAQVISENYEELSDDHEVSTKRLGAVMYRFHEALPFLTEKEKEYKQWLLSVKEDIGSLKSSRDTFVQNFNERKTRQPQSIQFKEEDLQKLHQCIGRQLTVQSSAIASIKSELEQLHDKLLN